MIQRQEENTVYTIQYVKDNKLILHKADISIIKAFSLWNSHIEELQEWCKNGNKGTMIIFEGSKLYSMYDGDFWRQATLIKSNPN